MGTHFKLLNSLQNSKMSAIEPKRLNQAMSCEPVVTEIASKIVTDRQLSQWRHGAKLAMVAGHYSQAIAWLSQVIFYLPESALDFNNRGLIYFYRGQLNKALRDYNRAIALDAALDSPFNNRANCYAALGQITLALADYEQGIDRNPLNLKTWLNWGITLREAADYDLALAKFEEALLIGDQLQDFQLQGRFYAERGYTHYLYGDWNWAIADYRRAIDKLLPHGRYRQKVVRLMQQLIAFSTGSTDYSPRQ